MESNEKQGIDSAAGGNSRGEAFSRLLIANRQRIYGFIFSLIHDRQGAEDVFQEVSAVLWRKFDRFEPGTDFAAWAMAIARLSIFEWRRRQQKVPLPLDEEELTKLADESLIVSLELEERQEALRQCLNRVKSEDRELLRSRYLTRETMVDMARRIRLSRVALYKRLNRLHQRLFDCVSRTLQEPPTP